MCRCRKCCKTKERKEYYDFVVVGAGNTGCVVANRLSENGKYTVCLLEAGRDDAKLKELLPESSPAPVPQPGDFNWGSYVRGIGAPVEFKALLLSRGFGHFEWYQVEDQNGPIPGRSTTYSRHSGWGGCTSHNFGVSTRNAPYNWQEWVDLGLTDWDASTENSNLIQFYKKVENRSQTIAPGVPFYNTALFNIADPNGPQPVGSYPPVDPAVPQFYGFNGKVPLLNFEFFQASFPPEIAEFQTVMQDAVGSLDPAFDYPLEAPGKAMYVDLDWPPAAHRGGLSFMNFSNLFQFGSITPPAGFFGLPEVDTPYPSYSEQLFPPNAEQPWNGPVFETPPELANFGFVGPLPVVNANSAMNYLYPAESRNNLTIKSEALATKLIMCGKCIKGIKYLEGWNIFQTGRNPNTNNAGYGGTVGAAKARAIKSKCKGEKTVYARKEVILCAGSFNTPQILQLSGIGDKADLEKVDVKVKHHLPGVGKSMVDNQELLIFWEGLNPINFFTLAAKPDTARPFPEFEIIIGGLSSMNNESRDPTIQNRWVGTKNIPAIYGSFVRNTPENILVATDVNPANPADVPFEPIMVSFENTNGMLIEQADNSLSQGYVQIVSKDPTVPAKVVMNYMENQEDVANWVSVFKTNVAPILLYLKNNSPQFFTNLLDPAPVDFLKAGITYENWTSVDDIDDARLIDFFNRRVGGHHAVATCKMGLDNDPLAVTDQKGKVHGLKGLRICDASVVPVSIRWPNITMYVVGEKISADILNEYP